MEFRRELVSQGVSEAGAEQALLGLPVAALQDQQAIKRLGYYVSPDGQVSLAKSLGPKSNLPKHWLDRERAPELGGNRGMLQISKAALLEKSAGPTLIGHKILSLSSSAGAATMSALLDKTRRDSKPTTDNPEADLK